MILIHNRLLVGFWSKIILCYCKNASAYNSSIVFLYQISLFSGFYCIYHYNDVIMGTVASQITSLAIVYSGADQRKHQSSESPAFVREIHRRPVNSPHKWPLTRKMFPFCDVIMRVQVSSDNWFCFPHKNPPSISLRVGICFVDCNKCFLPNIFLLHVECGIAFSTMVDYRLC